MTVLPPSLAANPDLDTWIRVDPTDTITVFTGKVELGQGLRAAIARVAAEELDVPPATIRVETVSTAHSPDEGYTMGSQSMSDGATAVRQAAAEARAHLLELAAAELDVAPAQLAVRDGVITAPDGSSTSYWQLLGGGRFGFAVTGDVAPKSPEQYRLVGKPGARPDVIGLVTGTLPFVQDLHLPGMLFGRVVRPPSAAAVFESVDAEPVRGLPGVVAVVCDGGFLAVAAEREEQADAAVGALSARARWRESESLPEERRLPDWLLSQPTQDFLVVEGNPVDAPVPPIETPAGAAQTMSRRTHAPTRCTGRSAPQPRRRGGVRRRR